MLRIPEHRQTLSLPPAELVTVEPIRAALERFRTANDALTAIRRQLKEVDDPRVRARVEEQDAQATADALDAGRKDPGPKHLQEYEARLADLRRRGRAAEISEARAIEQLAAASEEHGQEWLEQIAEDQNEARARFLEALDKLADAHLALAETEAIRAFAAGELPFMGPHKALGGGRLIDELRGIAEPQQKPEAEAQFVVGAGV